MPIDVSKPFIRALVKELVAHEGKAHDIPESTAPFVKKIGQVHYVHPRKSGAIDLYSGRVENDDVHDSYGSLCLFTDGKMGIVLHDLPTILGNKELGSVLFGVLAHELGHLINGDLDPKTPEESFSLRTVDGGEVKQKVLADNEKYTEHMRCVIVSTIKGGVIKNELAADVVAVEFVGLPTLLMTKMYDDAQTTNLTVLIEKRNRINRLMQMVKDGALTQRDDCTISITLE